MTPPNQYPPPPGHQFRAPPAYPPPPPGYGSPQPRTYSQGYGSATPGPPPPPGQYPVPPGFAQNKKTPGKAVAGLIIGISSLGIHLVSLISMGICCVITGPMGFILGIVGVILSGMAKKSIDLHPMTLKGRGLATAGQITSGAGIVIGIVTLVLGLIFFLSYFMAYT